MLLTADLLKKHGHLLSKEQRSIVSEFIRRRHAEHDFAFPEDMSTLEAQSAFILFERVFCEQPVYLFGQDVPSLAHTMIRIFRARFDGPEGEMVPDEEIFAARISEKTLSRAMLSTNQGDAGNPLTPTRLGGYTLPPFEPGENSTERASRLLRAEHDQNIQGRLNNARQQVGPGLTKPNAALKDAVTDLGYAVRDLLSGSYEVKSHLKNMGEIRNQALTEAAHAALHSQKVAAALSSATPLLPSGEAKFHEEVAREHPLANFALDPMPEDYREALRVLMIAELRDISQQCPNIAAHIHTKDGREYMQFRGGGRELSEMVGYGAPEGVREHVERIYSLWNHAFNSSIEESRRQYRMDQATLNVVQRSGDADYIHTSLPADDGSYFSLSFHSGYHDDSFGRARIRSRHAPLIEIEIVAQDLMTALRGHPEGRPVPCSIRQVAGVAKKPAPRPHTALLQDIDDVDGRIAGSPEAEALRKALSDLQALANAKRSGAKWREELEDALERFEQCIRATAQRAEGEIDDCKSRVDDEVIAGAQAMLQDISAYLPPNSLQVLGLKKP